LADEVRSWRKVDEEPWVTAQTSIAPSAQAQVWLDRKMRWKYLVSPKLSGANDVLMGIWVVDPGGSSPLHTHPNRFESFYVLEGRGVVKVGDEVIDAVPGTAIYIKPDVVHCVENHGTEPFVYLFVTPGAGREYQAGAGTAFEEKAS
jgi:quercetin dioxygenase-like cupin family protein